MNQEIIIGNYRVAHKIGEGGMGVVYAGEHTVLGRQAAIKLLLPEHLGDQKLSARFINEAKALATIRHPGIVEVYDFGYHQGGGLFIAMELLRGEDLSQRRDRGVAFSPEQAVLFAMQACGTLEAAHRAGITHRDLKPSNIFLVPDPQVPGGERVKLLDFGIAKFAVSGENGVAMTRAGAIMGTPTYMSPEQCLDSSKVDHRSDIYGLGCILYEMLCGRPPFVSNNVVDIMTMQIHDTPPLPSSLRPGLPPALDAVVLRALEKDRERRFQQAGEFAAALQQAMGHVNLSGGWLDASLGVSHTSSGAPGAMASGSSRSRWVIPLTVVLTVGLGLAGFLYTQKSADEPAAVEPAETTDDGASLIDKSKPPPAPSFEQLKSDNSADLPTPTGQVTGQVTWIVRTEPKGAEVRYQDKAVGHTATPLVVRAQTEPVREERLILRLDGHVERTLDLSTDKDFSDTVTLKRVIAVALITEPSGAQVYRVQNSDGDGGGDAEFQGNSNLELEYAEGETVKLRISKDGYAPVERDIVFDNNREEKIILAKPVSVYIQSEPEGAEVWLDDAKIGVTPYKNSELPKQKDKREFVLKREGCQDETIRLAGRRDDAKAVKLTCE